MASRKGIGNWKPLKETTIPDNEPVTRLVPGPEPVAQGPVSLAPRPNLNDQPVRGRYIGPAPANPKEPPVSQTAKRSKTQTLSPKEFAKIVKRGPKAEANMKPVKPPVAPRGPATGEP